MQAPTLTCPTLASDRRTMQDEPMLPRHSIIAWSAALIALGMAGCLFNASPECFEDRECAVGLVCFDRVCADPEETGEERDGGGPGNNVEDAAADARSGDGGAPMPPDAARSPDAAPPLDAGLDEPDAPGDCTPQGELCNGRDDDCDGSVDEGPTGCDVAGFCHWRHRGSQSYLFCDGATTHVGASQLCDGYGLVMAVTETCAEGEWMFATGNTIASLVEWNAADRGRAWWLGFELGMPDHAASLRRIDGERRPDEDCWMEGEPDSALDPMPLLGETCVDLRYNPARTSFGWNDVYCALTAANPVNALCETPCDPAADADRDGVGACVDCDDADASVGAEGAGCPAPPVEGLPPPLRPDGR